MTNFERAVGRMNLRKDPIIPMPTPARRDRPASEDRRENDAASNHIDIIIAVFALGVILGSLIA